MAAWLDVCRFRPSAGGTTDWAWSSAVLGYSTPPLAGAVNGRVYKLRSESDDLSQWELSEGAYTSGTGTFARTTVLYNSSGTGTGVGQSGAGTKINFATVPQVAVVALKEDLLSIEEANAFTTVQKSQALKNLGNLSSLVDATLPMGAAVDIATGDVNNLITDGFYMVEAACTNQPVASVQYYMLVQKYPPAGGAVQQTAWDVTAAGGMWNRTLLTTWGPWRQVGRPDRGQLWRLGMSTAGASTTMTIAAGEATDNIQAVPYLMVLPSAISKTTAAWAVGSGNGGIDTGSVAANTWYHWYLIARGDTGVVDAIFSLSAANPAYPAGYQFARRIGSMKTNGSSQWTSFLQYNDDFYLQASVVDSTTSPGTTDTLYTLASIPTGIRVKPFVHIYCSFGVVGEWGYRLRSPDLQTTETGISTSSKMSFGYTQNVARFGGSQEDVITNTSAQVNIIGTTAAGSFELRTYGWADDRGKLS